jgi:hypothetical protein
VGEARSVEDNCRKFLSTKSRSACNGADSRLNKYQLTHLQEFLVKIRVRTPERYSFEYLSFSTVHDMTVKFNIINSASTFLSSMRKNWLANTYILWLYVCVVHEIEFS